MMNPSVIPSYFAISISFFSFIIPPIKTHNNGIAGGQAAK
jgi:hypothetical protein